MATNPDDIRLSAEHRKLLAELADRSGQSWEDKLLELFQSHSQSMSSAAEHLVKHLGELSRKSAKRKLHAFNELCDSLQKLPSVNDGSFSNREHDQIIYGDK